MPRAQIKNNKKMLEILKANHDARMRWRARRKEEAHRGRAVLRAAKKALDQAAVRMVRVSTSVFQTGCSTCACCTV